MFCFKGLSQSHEMTSHPTPVRAPVQKRSQRTYDRLAGAILAAANDGSLSTLTLPRLAQRAGVSTGAFYGRFASKEVAVRDVLDRQTTAFVSRLSLLGAQHRPGRDVRGWIAAVTREFDDHARAITPLVRVLITTGAALPASAAHSPALRREAAALLTEWGVVQARQSERRAGFVLELVEAMTRNAALSNRRVDHADIEMAALWYLSAP